MLHKYYPAIVEQGEDGFGIFFPDLPGCVSFADKDENIVSAAEEALALHVQGMLEEGETLPPPSRLTQIQHDPDVTEVARILVRVETSTKKVRININMDEGLIAAIDAIASNRSEFLAKAARNYLTA
jgi:predicted RNase H-like HicB family nuclease